MTMQQKQHGKHVSSRILMKPLSISVPLLLALTFALGTPAFAQPSSPPAPTSSNAADDSARADAAIPEDDAPADATVPEDDAPADATIPEDTAPADESIPEDSTPPESATTTNQQPAAMNPAPADPRLLPVYKQFGELPGLTALMDDFMVQLLADKRTRPFFEQADQAMIKKHLAEQFCMILGGPCTYTGRDMKTVHAELGIHRSEFNALVEDLQIVMNKRHVPYHAQNKLLAKLAPLHRDIETK
jgi:hemoglobin